MCRTASTEPQCLYSTAIPLLPLWTVRPVQSLSACTVQLYLYSRYGPYGLYRASVPVQGCTLPLTLIGLWRRSFAESNSYVPPVRRTCVKGQSNWISFSSEVTSLRQRQRRHLLRLRLNLRYFWFASVLLRWEQLILPAEAGINPPIVNLMCGWPCIVIQCG